MCNIAYTNWAMKPIYAENICTFFHASISFSIRGLGIWSGADLIKLHMHMYLLLNI